MNVKDILTRFEKSDRFKNWREKNKDSFLAHFFVVSGEGAEHQCQVAFFNNYSGVMTSFFLSEGKITDIKEDKEVFKKPGASISELDMSKVKCDFEVALEAAIMLQRAKYKAHEPMKEIVILQNMSIGQVWNMTFVTKSFKTLNIKVDSISGEVLEDKLVELFQFG